MIEGVTPVEIPADPEERVALVGGSRCKINPDEWVASVLEPGESVVCVQNRRGQSGEPRTFVGIFKMAWFYDGVIAKVSDLSDVDHVTEESLHLEMGDKIWPARGAVMVEVVPA